MWNWPSWGLVRFLLLFSICWNWNIAVNLVIALLLMDLLQYPQIGIKYYFITSSLEVIGLFLFFLISRFWQNLVCIFVFVAIWVMVMIVYFLALDLCKKNPICICLPYSMNSANLCGINLLRYYFYWLHNWFCISLPLFLILDKYQHMY